MDKKLSEVLAEVFEKEMEELIQREANEPGFLPQEHFKTCRERAEVGVFMATRNVVDVMTAAIVKHRQETHGEDRSEELKAIDASSIALAESNWWSQ